MITPMNPNIAQELAAAVDRMPAFPRSVQRILELARDADSTPKDLVAVIDRDPVLTAKMLKVVNSAYFRLPKQINSIGHAVVFLGFNATKNLALGMAAIGMLPSENTAGFDWSDYLVHSVSTAAIARRLAARVDDADPMECFVAGLLHDFGTVVMGRHAAGEMALRLRRQSIRVRIAALDRAAAGRAARRGDRIAGGPQPPARRIHAVRDLLKGPS
jgi:HD-like signal output (HDOD) protein